MAVSENALATGLLLDNRYKIVSVLGEDWFGITYKAHDNSLDVPVVLKEYFPQDFSFRADDKVNVQPRPNQTEDFEFGLNQFVDEARTFAKYQHKNMIRISNIINTNGTAYYVKDFEEGAALDAWLAEHKIIDEKIILNIITSLLKGLEEIHGNGLIHRDINPGNIIIRKHGGAMLIDSGNARHAIAEQCRNLAITVTPGYSPPEQYSSRGKQGPHTDIYSIGAVLYRLIVGKDPIESVDRVHDVHEGEPDPLITASEAGHNKVSNWLLILTDQLLSIATKDRPQTAESVLTAIKNKTIVSVNTDFDSFFSDDDISDFTVKSVSQQENESVQATKEAPVGEQLNVIDQKDSVKESIDNNVDPETLAAQSQNQKNNTPVIIGGVLLLMAVIAGGYLYTQPAFLNKLLNKNVPVENDSLVQKNEIAAAEKAKQLAAEEEAKRIAAEKAKLAESKKAKQLAAEKKAKQIAVEKAKLAESKKVKQLAAQKEAKRIAAEKAKKLAAAKEAKRKAAEKAKKLAAEKEAKRKAAEKAKRVAAEKEAKRIAAEKEAKRIAKEKEAKRIAAENEAKRLAAEKEAKRIADEREAKRLAKEKFEAETKARIDQAASYRDQAFSKAMEGNVDATRELLKKASALVIDTESDRTILEGAISQKKALGR